MTELPSIFIVQHNRYRSESIELFTLVDNSNNTNRGNALTSSGCLTWKLLDIVRLCLLVVLLVSSPGENLWPVQLLDSFISSLIY